MSTLDRLPGTPLDVEHEGLSYRQVALRDLQARGVPAGVILSAVKADLRARVDDAAEALRGRVVTPGPGQAMEYQEAQSQAVAALKAPSAATPDRYPMLAASIGVDFDPTTGAPATDVLGVARSVQAAYAAWSMLGAAIRGARLAGKATIMAATTIEEAGGAFDAIAWPTLPV